MVPGGPAVAILMAWKTEWNPSDTRPLVSFPLRVEREVEILIWRWTQGLDGRLNPMQKGTTGLHPNIATQVRMARPLLE